MGKNMILKFLTEKTKLNRYFKLPIRKSFNILKRMKKIQVITENNQHLELFFSSLFVTMFYTCVILNYQHKLFKRLIFLNFVLCSIVCVMCQCCNEASKIFVQRSIFVFSFGSFSDAEESLKLRRF